MTKGTWIMLAVGLAAVLVGPSAAYAALDALKRGRRLSSGESTPAAGAAAATKILGRTVDPDAYALARMVRSEAGRENGVHKAAVAHVALNDARANGWTVAGTVTMRRGGSGTFGAQSGGGRYATTRDPYENDLAVAEQVLSGALPDPTGGAVKFVHRTAFGVQEGTTTYAGVVARWGEDGLRPREIPGASGSLVVFVQLAGVT